MLSETNAGEHFQRSSDETAHLSAIEEIGRRLTSQGSFRGVDHGLVLSTRKQISRILFLDFIYRSVLDVPGVVLECGVQWGSTLALLTHLRGIHEPYNHSRKIIGFDNFMGFQDITLKDGLEVSLGDYEVGLEHEAVLNALLRHHEGMSPLPHISKFEIVSGDAAHTVPNWIHSNPWALVSLAIFDMDVYLPTKSALEAVLPRLTRGSILLFDQLNAPHFAGETAALQEVLGSRSITLKRYPHQTYCAYAIYGE